MKKILILLLIAVLAVSTCFITACDPNDEGKVSVSSSTSSEEGSDSSDGFISRTSGSFEDSSSSNSVNSNSSSNSISNSGSGVVIPSIDPGDTNTPLGQAIAAINMIGSITASNYAQKEEYLAYAQSKCDAISDKSLIPNYSYFLEAKEAFKEFKETGDLVKFLDDFDNLPSEITGENYLSFYAMIDRYNNKLSDSQKAKVPDEVKNKLSEYKTVVDLLPKPSPTPTTEYAKRTEENSGFKVTWNFTNSSEENKTIGSYLKNGHNDSGLSYHASGETARIKKTELSMNTGAAIVVPVGKYTGNIKIVPTGSSDNRHFALETGGDYSNTASIKPGTITTDYYKKLWSKPASQPTDTHRGPQDFNFTIDDLTFVGAPFHDLCLILVAQSGEMKIGQLILTRG